MASINIDNTKFIFRTNFSGDPERDNYGSSDRKATILIPTEEQAMELKQMGLNVKMTKPQAGHEDEYVPQWHVPFKVNYDSEWPPRIFVVTQDEFTGEWTKTPKDENTVGDIDSLHVKNVSGVFNVWYDHRHDSYSLWARILYVEGTVDDDPYAARYRNYRVPATNDNGYLPFD